MQSGGMAVAQQAAKRQRLNHAAQLEDERTERVRSLVAKVSTFKRGRASTGILGHPCCPSHILQSIDASRKTKAIREC